MLVYAGKEADFEAIFRRHYSPLLAYCRHMLGDMDEAEDALQQSFIRAHRALLNNPPPREIRPWLYKIARNCCLSAIAARRRTVSLEDHEPSFAGLSEEVQRREELRELLADVGRLPEEQRSALLLAELEDLDHEAIATVVGCPVSKVKALIYQARCTLIAERDARDASCREIREQLAVARGGELRRGPLRRHLRMCAGCRDFQEAVGVQRQSLAAVLPVLPSAALAAKILGGTLGGSVAATGSSAGAIGAGAGTGAGGLGGAAGGGTMAAGGSATGGGAFAAGGGSAAGGGAFAAGGGSAAAGSATAAGVGATAGAGAVGTSAGTLLGGGVVVKAAVTGALALATVGAVAAHNRSAGANANTNRAVRQAHISLPSPGNQGGGSIEAPEPPVSNGLPAAGSPSGASGQAPSPSGETVPAAQATPGETAPSTLATALPAEPGSSEPGPVSASEPAAGLSGAPAAGSEQAGRSSVVDKKTLATRARGKALAAARKKARQEKRRAALLARRLARERRRELQRLRRQARLQRLRELREQRRLERLAAKRAPALLAPKPAGARKKGTSTLTSTTITTTTTSTTSSPEPVTSKLSPAEIEAKRQARKEREEREAREALRRERRRELAAAEAAAKTSLATAQPSS